MLNGLGAKMKDEGLEILHTDKRWLLKQTRNDDGLKMCLWYTGAITPNYHVAKGHLEYNYEKTNVFVSGWLLWLKEIKS